VIVKVEIALCEVFEGAVLLRRCRLTRHRSLLIGMSSMKSHELSWVSWPCTVSLWVVAFADRKRGGSEFLRPNFGLKVILSWRDSDILDAFVPPISVLPHTQQRNNMNPSPSPARANARRSQRANLSSHAGFTFTLFAAYGRPVLYSTLVYLHRSTQGMSVPTGNRLLPKSKILTPLLRLQESHPRIFSSNPHAQSNTIHQAHSVRREATRGEDQS
jgi:hypothetical protein